MKIYTTLAAVIAAASAQNVTVPSTCTEGFMSGHDEVIYTVPYTYDQVMSIIGSYKNLTWSGNPDDTVSLNGTDNMVGTARTYDLAGAHVIETILMYSKPPAPGPYEEVHNTALLTVPSVNLSAYIPYDGTTVTSICDGKASTFNFTADFCASNATVAGATLHSLHLGDAITVGKFLGGQNFTSCEALGVQPNATATTTGGGTITPTPYQGGAGGKALGIGSTTLMLLGAVLAAL